MVEDRLVVRGATVRAMSAGRARELIENCAALLLDFDGPMTQLLPPPKNGELAQAAMRPPLAAGVDLPPEIEETMDHLKVLR